MNNRYKLSTIWMMCLLLLSGMSFTSCSNDDLNTDQYGNDISLNSFGPCPVLRGGVLRFLGSNLDQITAVTIPGCDPITNITVVASGTHSEITVEVPKENCTEGVVTLTTPKGGTLTTNTPISYREDIVLTKFYVGADGTLSGNMGDVVTVEGDYLNLIHAVVFSDGVTVPETEFITHTRYKIEVAIPKHAKTGKIQLSDENPDGANYLYSDAELTVNLPTCTAMSPARPKAGATMTFKGTSLGLIQYVAFAGAEVDSTALTISGDGTQLLCAVPAKATDGEVSLVTYSGVKISCGDIETVVPTALVAAPKPIKNGETLTITGKDLDLVSGIIFPSGVAGTPVSQSETKITAVVPEKAQAGDITLSLENGKTVSVAYTLVEPAVTACAPASVIAGNVLTLTGTDLDLVSAVAFSGDGSPTATKLESQSATEIKVAVPAVAAGAGCLLILKNGAKVAVSGVTVVAATDPAIATSPAYTAQGKTITLTGKNFTNAETFYIGTTKITKFSDRSDTSVTFTVPSNCAGDQTIYMYGYDGAKFTGPAITVYIDITPLCVLQSDQGTAATFPMTLSWDDSGRFRVLRDGTPNLVTMGLTAGKSKLVIMKNAHTGQAQINNGNWGSFTTLSDWDGNTTITMLETTFTQDMVDWCTGAQSDGWSKTALLIQGDGFTVSSLYVLP